MSQATAQSKSSKEALLSPPGALLYQEAATEGPEHFSRVGALDVWMFSAFYDRDTGGYGGPIVRLFGLAARAYKNRPVLCRFGLPGQGEVTTKGRLLMMPDDHMVKIPPFEVECPVKKGPLPTTVSVSVENDKGATDRIAVEYRNRRSRKREFTVCFASFHSKYNFTSQLVQAVEMNLLLGAEHFFLYNTSVSSHTDQVIRHYQALWIFTVVQWPVPNESWYKAQMALINDCMYRNRNQSEYVVFTDTDEFIIPRSHMNWHDMVSDLFRDPSLSHVFTNPANGGVPAANSMLPRRRLLSVAEKGGAGRADVKTGTSNGNTPLFHSYKIQPLSVFTRTDYSFADKVRTKIIARPEFVHTMGIHFIRREVKGSRSGWVKPEVGLLHHYRFFDWKHSNHVDHTAYKFKDEFIARLKVRFAALRKIFP